MKWIRSLFAFLFLLISFNFTFAQDSIFVKWFNHEDYPHAPSGTWLYVYEIGNQVIIREGKKLILFNGTEFLPVFTEYNFKNPAFYQDDDDYLWIMDSTRIIKYDGETIEKYTIPNLTKQVNDKRLNRKILFKDSKKHLWISFSFAYGENKIINDSTATNRPKTKLFNFYDGKLSEIKIRVDGFQAIDNVVEIQNRGIYFFFNGLKVDTVYAQGHNIAESDLSSYQSRIGKYADGEVQNAEKVLTDLTGFREAVDDSNGNTLLFFNGNGVGERSGIVLDNQNKIEKLNLPIDLAHYHFTSAINLMKNIWSVSLESRNYDSAKSIDIKIFRLDLRAMKFFTSPLEARYKKFLTQNSTRFPSMYYEKKHSIFESSGGWGTYKISVYKWQNGQWSEIFDIKTNRIQESKKDPNRFYLLEDLPRNKFGLLNIIHNSVSPLDEALKEIEGSPMIYNNKGFVTFLGRKKENRDKISLFIISGDTLKQYKISSDLNFSDMEYNFFLINLLAVKNDSLWLQPHNGKGKYYLGVKNFQTETISLTEVFSDYQQIFFNENEPALGLKKWKETDYLSIDLFRRKHSEETRLIIPRKKIEMVERYIFKVDLQGNYWINFKQKDQSPEASFMYSGGNWVTTKSMPGFHSHQLEYLGNDQVFDYFYNIDSKSIVYFANGKEILLKKNFNFQIFKSKENFLYSLFRNSDGNGLILIQNRKLSKFNTGKHFPTGVYSINNLFYIPMVMGYSKILIDNTMIDVDLVNLKNSIVQRDMKKIKDDKYVVNYYESTNKWVLKLFCPKYISSDILIYTAMIADNKRTFPKSIHTSFQDNKVSFNFCRTFSSANSFTLYSSILEGFDKEWSDYSKNNSAQYGYIPEGEYTFRVKSFDRTGRIVYSKPIPVTVLPPWYQTWWFYSIEGLLFLGLIATGFSAQRKRLKRILNQKRQDDELEYARQVQLSMLPQNNIRTPKLEITGFMKTASEVGGDYYDFIELDDEHYVVVLGDATGHGVGAGMMVGMVKSALTQALKQFQTEESSLSGLMMTLNETLRESVKQRGLGMCLSIAVINHKTGDLKVSSTGLPYPYHFRSEKGHLQSIAIDGPPLGLMKQIKSQSQSLKLAPDDSFILLSDGFPERLNHQEQSWGYDKLEESLLSQLSNAKKSEEVIKGLLEENEGFSNGRENDDDMTVVVIKKVRS